MFYCIGLPVTAAYAAWLASRAPFGGRRSPPWIRSFGEVSLDIRPVQILCLLLIVGVLLDVVCIKLQKLRWDRDWPFAFQFCFSIGEFAIVLTVIRFDLLPFMPARWIGASDYPAFFLYFALVFVPSFVALLGFIQIFMVRWRYKGGEWGRL